MKILKDLMVQTHQNVLFNSTVFACHEYVPFYSKLGGDCLDQVYYLYSIAMKKGLEPVIVSFDRYDNPLFHVALIINNYYIDPTICLVEPLPIDGKWKELTILGYDKIHFKVENNNNNIDFYVKTSKSIDKRTSKRNVSIRDLFNKQIYKSVERMSAVMIKDCYNESVSVFKIKEFGNNYWYIKDDRAVFSEGIIPNRVLIAFAEEAKIDTEYFVSNWKLARRLLHKRKNDSK